MKPMMILPPDVISNEDIELLRANGICVVIAKDPSMVRFVDPLPAASSRTKIEDAAIGLSRILLAGHWGDYTNEALIGRGTIAKMFADLLVKGTVLDPSGGESENQKKGK